MAENRVEANAHNAGGCPASNAIHGHINDFLVRTGLRSGVSELQLPCFTAVSAYFHERRSLNNFHRDRVITFEQIAE